MRRLWAHALRWPPSPHVVAVRRQRGRRRAPPVAGFMTRATSGPLAAFGGIRGSEAEAFGTAPVGMALAAPGGRFVTVNDALCELLGYTREELLSPDCVLDHPDDSQLTRSLWDRALAAHHGIHSVDRQCVDASGRAIWGLFTTRLVRDAVGEPSHAVVVVQDVTERKRIEHQLAYRAFHDDLTGLANRSLFLDRLRHALSGARRRGEATAVLFVDLDGFKEINDRHGHATGDAVLRATAERLETELRTADSIARFGGDEFVVLQEDVNDVADAILIADRLQAAISVPVETSHGVLSLTASIGIAVSESALREDALTLITRADAAMYRAKVEAGNQCAI
jgi:diguanylate cyclase (GGDEF)-like protein/PAS domain S-box-containing protein